MTGWPFLHRDDTPWRRILQRVYIAAMKRATKRAMRQQRVLMDVTLDAIRHAYEEGYKQGLLHGHMGLLRQEGQQRKVH